MYAKKDLRPIHSRRDADATRTPQMFNVLLINGYFHSRRDADATRTRRRRDADATRTPQSRDKIVLTFWSVPLFSRKGNSLLAVYHRAIHMSQSNFPPPSALRSRRVRVASASRESRLHRVRVASAFRRRRVRVASTMNWPLVVIFISSDNKMG